MKIKKKYYTFLLLVAGAVFSFYYIVTSDFSFSILPHNESIQYFNIPEKELIAGKKISGEITASENHLGIIALRINTFDRENEDIIHFRLKEKGSKNWYADKPYRTTFGNNELYNFGFPLIENSKGKTYIVEIQSVKGIPGNAISISREAPVIVSKYKFPKQELLSNPEILYSFLSKKIFYIVSNGETLFALFIFFLPFLYYTFFRNYFSYKVSILLFFILLLYNSLFLNEYHTIIILYSLASWIGLIWHVRDKALLSFKIGLALLLLQLVVYAIMGDGTSERLSTWSFIFIAYATVCSMYSLIKKKHDT